MTTEIIYPIAKFIAEKILKQPSKVITADEALISSGLIDSFSLMDLALFIEDTFRRPHRRYGIECRDVR
jgi:acyl carrier protein